jgi:hypothetical protein
MSGGKFMVQVGPLGVRIVIDEGPDRHVWFFPASSGHHAMMTALDGARAALGMPVDQVEKAKARVRELHPDN